MPHRVTDACGDLDVEVEDLLGKGDEVGQGQGDGLPDASDRSGDAQGDSPPRRGQVVNDVGHWLVHALLVPSQQGVQGLTEQRRVGLVLGGSALGAVPARLRGGVDDLAGQRRQGAQVAGTDAEAGQEPDHPVSTLGVGGGGQQGTDVGDLGHVEHPAQTDDRVGQARRLQLSCDGLHLRPGPAQDGHLGAGRPALGEECGHSTGLLDRVLEEGSVDRPGLQTEGDGACSQRGDGDVLPHGVTILDDAGAQWLGDGVGHLEDGGVVAPGG